MEKREMNIAQLDRMHSGKGFIAALDQSGGSTPKALAQYGVQESSFTNDEEMYTLIHEMRTRIIKSPAFNSLKTRWTVKLTDNGLLIICGKRKT